jgi:DNA-binding NarL/FixJ family response regulator
MAKGHRGRSRARRGDAERPRGGTPDLDALLAQFDDGVRAAALAEAARITAAVWRRHDKLPPAMLRAARSIGVSLSRSRPGKAAGPMRSTRDTVIHPFLDHARTRTVLSAIVAERRLARRQADVLTALVAGVPRSFLAKELGLGENSIKTYVGQLLRKLKQRDLADAVWWVRRQIVRPRQRPRRARHVGDRR